MAENDLKQLLQEQEQRIITHVGEKAVETQRHFDVVVEHLTSEIQTVAEQVGSNTEGITQVQEKLEQLTSRMDNVELQLDNLGGMRSSVESMREDVSKMRVHLEVLRDKMGKKPSYDDLASLDKRVWRLEQKLQGS